jgi:hypothetical protein
MTKHVDKLLEGKVVKSAQKSADGFYTIYFCDGSQLNIFIEDNDELICELLGKETELHDIENLSF